MSFSGITVNCICHELNSLILGGRISKISQPEPYGLIVTVHTENGNKRLYISANASLPLMYITEDNKPSPATAYNFLMVLRKHIGAARVIGITQPSLERVICIKFEHLDDMRDIAHKRLYVELMGKHSNIIFTDENDRIIDSIKHIGSNQSSVREVLPGRDYFIPAQEGKFDPLNVDKNTFFNKVLSRHTTAEKGLSGSFLGFSRQDASELCERAGFSGDTMLDILHESEKGALYNEFIKLNEVITSGSYSPEIIYDGKKPLEYSPFPLTLFKGFEHRTFSTISEVLSNFYQEKNKATLMAQKAIDLKKLVSIHIERSNKKLALQEKQLQDTLKSQELKIYGELLLAFGHDIKGGQKSVTLSNYYDNNNPITIPLDPDLSGIENSKKYFKRYEKLKRTGDALLPQLEKTKNEIAHLSSIHASLLTCENEDDLALVRQELSDFGFIKKGVGKGKSKKSSPLHYVTEDGFHLYVGKNNYQNEEVTFKIGRGNDWWFHSKGIPGSHVILKTEGREVPDHVFEIAAGLAAYYSSGRDEELCDIDYVLKKELKKVPGAAPGFVIYYTNFSMTIAPDISRLSIVS